MYSFSSSSMFAFGVVFVYVFQQIENQVLPEMKIHTTKRIKSNPIKANVLTINKVKTSNN